MGLGGAMQLYKVITDNIGKGKKELDINLKNGNVLKLNFAINKSLNFILYDGANFKYSYYWKQKHIDKMFGKNQ